MDNMGMNGAPPLRVKKGGFVGKAILGAVVLVFALIVVFSSFSIVSEGFIGVKYRFGKIVNADLPAGLNFKVPMIETVSLVDVREQLYEATTTAYTKDTQTVENLLVKLNYYYNHAQLPTLIRNVGISNVESKLIIPQVQSILKNEIGQFRAEELIQNRSNVQENIEQKLFDSLGTSGIIVTAFALENIDFEDGFEEAVRAKVVAEQDALKMQNKTKEQEELAKQEVIKAQAEADSSKIKAEAEAYAIQKVQEQLQSSPNYIEYQKVNKWNGEFPGVMGNEVNPFVLLDDAKDAIAGQ